VRWLLDTHVWIWSQEAVEKLGPQTVEGLRDPRMSLSVSTVSTLEIARLVARGTIEISGRLEDWVATSLDTLACDTLEISHRIAMGAYALPEPFHRDPADRILVSTARCHDLTLLTADERILDYPHVKSQDARS
jgi:PIN domain nuclease of toxin-antitoxin system